jgi:hypothetical protein
MKAIDRCVAIDSRCLHTEGIPSMRARITITCGLACWLVLLWIGCSSEQGDAEYPRVAPEGGTVATTPEGGFGGTMDSGAQEKRCYGSFLVEGRCMSGVRERKPVGPVEACVKDEDCRSGFCDRGTCGDRVGLRGYGLQCKPDPPYQPKPPPPPPPPGEFYGAGQAGIPACMGYLCLEGRCRSCDSDAECKYWYGSGDCGVFSDNDPGKSCGRIFDMGPPGPPPQPPPDEIFGPPGPSIFPPSRVFRMPPTPTASPSPSSP